MCRLDPQGRLDSASAIINDETSCQSLPVFSPSGKDVDIYTDVKEVGRGASFRCIRKPHDERGRQIRKEIQILGKMDAVAEQYEPGCLSGGDIPDGRIIIQVDGTPPGEDPDAISDEGDSDNENALKIETKISQRMGNIGKKEIRIDQANVRLRHIGYARID